MPVKKARTLKPVRKGKLTKKKAVKKPSRVAKRMAIRRAKKRTAVRAKKAVAAQSALRQRLPEPQVEIVEVLTTEVQEYPLASLIIEEQS